MCTCIQFQTKHTYFGRNLDLEYRFGEKVVITPRNYRFLLKNENAVRTKYAMIGMASVMQDYPLYAEAANEKGLAMAGLYFPGNAHFFKPAADKLNLATYELIPYLLGQYESVAEIRTVIAKLNITDVPFTEGVPVSALHWMISDETECIVMEQTKDGLQIYDNNVRVLTNNPPFPYHMYNLNNYMNLESCSGENRFSDSLKLHAYGQGMGAIGLPGDASPASRFVRAAYHLHNSVCSEDEESSVTQFFHILESVAMVQGTVITQERKCDITTYSCCINTTEGIFYYKTYTNSQMTAVRMREEEKNKTKLTIYELTERQQIKYEN